MNGDARISVSFPSHPKTKKLIRRTGYEGAWGLVCLFLWTAQNRPSGDLSGFSDEDLEIAIDWIGKPGAFISALFEVGFIEGPEGSRIIHDWAQHNPWAATFQQRSDIAKRAAAKRWEKKYGEHAPRIENGCTPHALCTENDADRNAPLPSPSPSPSPSPNPKDVAPPNQENQTSFQKENKKQNGRKSQERTIPENFCISERVRKWADEKGHGDLEEYFERFVGYVKRKGKKYADWDEALMSAIREDWGDIRAKKQKANAAPTMMAEDIFK